MRIRVGTLAAENTVREILRSRLIGLVLFGAGADPYAVCCWKRIQVAPPRISLLSGCPTGADALFGRRK